MHSSNGQPKLGMNMLLWSTDVTAPEHDATFELLRELGYDGVEIPIFDSEVEKYAPPGQEAGRSSGSRPLVSAPGPARTARSARTRR